MRVNARGNSVQAREAFRVGDRGGSIASVPSVVASETQTAHAASEGALAQITRVLAIEGGPKGIRSKTVLPGVIDTDSTAGVVDNGREMRASVGPSPPGRPDRTARRGRRGGGVPGLRRGELHHRRAGRRRRRGDRPVTTPAGR
ncbi:hypothetical protein GCM10023108_03840 [Saccharopolyspora hordei]